MTESEMTQKRMIDLSRMCYERGIYTYSDFLTLAEQSDFAEANRSGKLYTRYMVYGGCDGTERVMVRFGSENELGYDEPWPISCIKIEPTNHKFAEDISHRDVLGSLMNMGIERSLLGDILIKSASSDSGKSSRLVYVFAKSHIADTICQELTRIRHTTVYATVIDEMDEGISPNLVDVNMQVKSERIDLIVAHVFKLSRSQAAEMFLGKRIYVNGRLMENESHTLKADDVVSARGCGRFIYKGATGTTKKGNLNVCVSKYV